MALVYPGSAAVPRYESSLAALLPALESGRKDRKDELALDAAAKAFGGSGAQPQPQQSALERLLGFGQSASGAFTRPEAAAPPTNSLPANAMRMGQGDVVQQSHSAAEGAVDPSLETYFANARTAESGGNDAAKNPNSTATGRYQFLDSTWRGLMEQYPDLGLTAEGRTDGDQQERAMARFTQDNARTLAGAGLPVNPGTLYAAHFLGAGGASNVLSQDLASPLSAYLQPGVLEANPNLNGMTVGDFAAWANEKGGGGGGGYRPPMRNEGQVPGARQFAPDPDTLRTLLASEATRPLAVSLIQAQEQADASQGRYVTEQGADGAIFQRDTLTGETKVIMTPKQADPALQESFFGNTVFMRDPATGNVVAGQVSNRGNFKPIEAGEGYQPAIPVQQLDTGTGFVGVDKFGNQTGGVTPIDNFGEAFDTAAGKAAAEKIQSLPQTLATADNMLGTIDGVLNDPALDSATGWLSWMQAVPGTDQFRFGTRALQLQGQAFLQAFESLKGGGQITEVEGTKATQAIGRLSTAQSPEDYRDALNELKGIINGAKTRASSSANAPRPQAPAAAPPAAPAVNNGPVTITDDAGYDALPSGTRFVGPDGVEREKP